MKTFLLLCLGLLALPVQAAVTILACEPEWAALAKELGGERVTVASATTARQDPHRIEARPSLIAKTRNADLLVCSGAELESGWLPVLLRESGNAKIQPGKPGYFEATRFVTLLEKPARLDRSEGDIHASGNPHIHSDPRNMAAVAEGLARTLVGIDPHNASFYQQRLHDFKARWEAALQRWTQKAAPLRGMPVVQQHRNPYLAAWLKLETIAELEPAPGVEPSLAHLGAVLGRLKEKPARMVLRPVYFSARPSEWLAARAGIPAVELPFTVGGNQEAADLFGLYEDTLNRLLAALK